MSILRRMSDVFQQKVSAAVDKAEDPSQALDLSYQKQLDALQQARRSVADVLTSEKRLELQADQLTQSIAKLQDQARTALSQGKEDLAKLALTRAQVARTQLDGLNQQIESVKQQEQKLEITVQKLQARIETFRMQRDTMKAQYAAAKASTNVSEAATGLSEQMADASMMVDRSRDKIAQMQARSAAVGQLLDSGVLDDVGSTAGDDIDRQLGAGRTDAAVQAQLEAMKQQIALPSANIVVRVQGEGQFRLASSYKGDLDAYDRKVMAAIEAGEAAALKQAVHEVIAFVQSHGVAVPDSENAASQVVLPSEDLTLDEAKKIMAGSGADA
jgi:phage shock protein A